MRRLRSAILRQASRTWVRLQVQTPVYNAPVIPRPFIPMRAEAMCVVAQLAGTKPREAELTQVKAAIVYEMRISEIGASGG
jgi:hypothetical protein